MSTLWREERWGEFSLKQLHAAAFRVRRAVAAATNFLLLKNAHD